MSDLSLINEKIQALVKNNPAMSRWPKHKKKYARLMGEHGEDYSSQNCKPEHKKFLLFFEALRKVRLEIKALKEQKLILKNKPVFEKRVLSVRSSPKNTQREKRQLTGRKAQSFIAGGFKSEVQAGIWAKKR